MGLCNIEVAEHAHGMQFGVGCIEFHAACSSPGHSPISYCLYAEFRVSHPRSLTMAPEKSRKRKRVVELSPARNAPEWDVDTTEVATRRTNTRTRQTECTILTETQMRGNQVRSTRRARPVNGMPFILSSPLQELTQRS